jgi:RNA polymerase sigma-70 factor (ECF subfamily)
MEKVPEHYLNVCRKFTDCEEDAKDAFQEASIKLWLKSPEIENENAKGRFYYLVMKNTAINIAKRKKKFEKLQEYHSVEYPYYNEFEILKVLPKGYKRVFYMRVVLDMRFKEIAELLFIKEATARSQFFKARKFLKNILAI